MIKIQSSGLEWVKQISEKFAQHLLRKGEQATQKHSNKPLKTRFGELYRFILITKDTNTYAIDFNDTDQSQLDHTDITKVLKCQYNPNLSYYKTVPYTYFPKNPNLLQSMLPQLRKISRILPLYFRGKAHGKRDNILLILNYNFNMPANEISDIEEYYRECSLAKVGLSLPGHGNFCHREIEYFGMGVPVIMPKLINSCYNNLIPDRHYLSVDVSYDQSAIEIARKIMDRYAKITPDEMDYISGNAMKWYEENVMFPNCIELALGLFD
jgi:hypothetical protein